MLLGRPPIGQGNLAKGPRFRAVLGPVVPSPHYTQPHPEAPDEPSRATPGAGAETESVEELHPPSASSERFCLLVKNRAAGPRFSQAGGRTLPGRRCRP